MRIRKLPVAAGINLKYASFIEKTAVSLLEVRSKRVSEGLACPFAFASFMAGLRSTRIR